MAAPSWWNRAGQEGSWWSRAKNTFKEIANRIIHPRRTKALRVIANEVMENTKAGFLEGRDPDGNAWPPLKYREGKPLLLTGSLFAAATHAAAHPYVADNELLITVPEPFYGIFHMTGVARRNVPARRWIGLNDKQIEMAIELLGTNEVKFMVDGVEVDSVTGAVVQ